MPSPPVSQKASVAESFEEDSDSEADGMADDFLAGTEAKSSGGTNDQCAPMTFGDFGDMADMDFLDAEPDDMFGMSEEEEDDFHNYSSHNYSASQAKQQQQQQQPPQRSKPKPVVKKTLPKLTYTELVNTQGFNGSFDIDLDRYHYLDSAIAALKNLGVRLDVIKTVLGIYLLQTEFADKQAEWFMMVNKAQSFVKNSGHQTQELLSLF